MIELIQLAIKNIKRNPIITIAFTIIVCTLISMSIFLRVIYIEVIQSHTYANTRDEKELKEEIREIRESQKEMNRRFDRMNERFDKIYEILLEKQKKR